MEMEPGRVSELRRIAQDPVSLEMPLGEEEDSTLGDFVEDTDAEVPVEAASFKLLQEYLGLALEGLNERERQVLVMRFGLADGKIRTLEQVGSHFKVTRERIRQIETKASPNSVNRPEPSGSRATSKAPRPAERRYSSAFSRMISLACSSCSARMARAFTVLESVNTLVSSMTRLIGGFSVTVRKAL